jgi:CxxC motif-containing protein (DUF1111 family)
MNGIKALPFRWSAMLLATVAMLAASSGARADNAQRARDHGQQLFTREWLPGDSRSRAGDGLGPLYNARSCLDCHHLGGVGGAGPRYRT